MAEDKDDRESECARDGAASPPQVLVPAPVFGAPFPMAPGFPMTPYAAPLYPPSVAGSSAADRTEIKLSEAVPPQVRSELNWLVRTAKQNRMPIGVVVTCHRLLLLILHDLETSHRPQRLRWRSTALDRLRAPQKAGAVTRSIVEEAQMFRLEPPSRVETHAALMGDPSDAARYVAFLRLLVDVAYEAQAKYRKSQGPTAKPGPHGMTMSVTVGPPTSGGSSS